jgi:hypothetical protein
VPIKDSRRKIYFSMISPKYRKNGKIKNGIGMKKKQLMSKS